MVQPSRVDLRVADEFRVFRNTRYPFIDVRNPMEDLTDVVRVRSEEAFILHHGEFVFGQHARKRDCLFEMTSPAERPYGERGKYQGERGPTPSKFYQDFIKQAGEIGHAGPLIEGRSLSEKESPS